MIRSRDRWVDLSDVQIGGEWFYAADSDPECSIVGGRVGPARQYDDAGMRVPGVAMIVIRRRRR